MAGRYAGRLAVVAGGLGGLGSTTAKLLHSSGAELALLYAPFEAGRRDELLTAAFGTTRPPRVTTYECDITSDGSVTSAFNDISSALTATPKITPSILINSAGFCSVAPMHETSGETALRNFLPNLLGPFIVSNAWFRLYRSAVSKLEKEQQSSSPVPPGRIVSVSSQAAHKALPDHGAYCASKAGLQGLVRSQALEWGPHGITSNTVSPTVALTELGKQAWADPTMRDNMLAQIPAGRFCEPDEIASAIEWLCRDENGMINGADVRIDGGFSIR